MKKSSHFLFLLLIALLVVFCSLVACNVQQAGPNKSLELTVTQTFDVYKDSSNPNLYHADSITTTSSYAGTLKQVVEGVINEVDLDGGGTIAFRAGVFDLGSDSLKIVNRNNITFEGQGIDITTIKNHSNNTTLDTEPFNATNSDNITIRDLTVSAGGGPRLTSDAIDGDGANNWLIENVKIDKSRGSGIILDGKGDGQKAENNTIRDCVIDGDDISGNGIELLAAKNNLIEDCTITNISNGVGISINKSSDNPTQGQPNKKSNDNIIRNNTINNSGRDGVKVNSGNRNTITGNALTNGATNGIHLISRDGITCDGNIIEFNTAADNIEYGLTIADPECNRTVVWDNNNFTGNGVGDIDDNGTNTIYKSGGGAGNLTFTPTDDATIRESSPNHNYGNSANIEADGSPRKDALLRFNVNGVGTASVNTATLRLYATDGSNLGGDFVEITTTSGSWDEGTVTWNNAPAGNGISLGSLGKVSPGNWYELNVTPLVNGDGPVSIRISSSSSNGADYASKENSNGNASELLITTD